MRFFINLTILFIIFLSSANASNVHGWLTTCGEHLSDVDNDSFINVEARVGYLKGYITGKNDALNSRTGKGISHESLQYALEKYCRENPLHDTWDASRSIYKELK